jgi:ATP-dependent DNA ligase
MAAASPFTETGLILFCEIPRIAGAVKLSGFVKPMLAELSARPAFTDDKWIFEIKWDGYRCIAEVNSETTNRLYSPNGPSFAKAFPQDI